LRVIPKNLDKLGASLKAHKGRNHHGNDTYLEANDNRIVRLAGICWFIDICVSAQLRAVGLSL
jgi:hypothetical protein